MTEYNRPKLFEALKGDGTCVVCEDELQKGFAGWAWNKNGTWYVACPSHKAEAVIDAVDALRTGDREITRPIEQTPISEALKGLDETLARIAHLLEQIYKNGGLPK